MSHNRNTVIRSMHDLGAAAWFGGALMGAIGLNGASESVSDPSKRAKVASAGWARWAPANATAIGTHLIGGAGLVLAHRDRVAGQSGVQADTIVKTVITGAALATTAYSGVLGAKLAKAGAGPAESGTKPNANTPDDAAKTQQQLRLPQWATPALTAVIVVSGPSRASSSVPVNGLEVVLHHPPLRAGHRPGGRGARLV